jgi:altronate dehydratase large subunit
MNFLGYVRSDGRVGIRNKVLILPTCSCSSSTANIISQQVDGTISFVNQLGCAQTEKDLKYTIDVLVGFAANPNIYGTVVVGNGCETTVPDMLIELIGKKTNKPIKRVVIQEDGGTLGAVEKGTKFARELVEDASKLNREEVDISKLIVATECGGSDSTSGLAANPVVGNLSDILVEHGATSILSETTEFIGAEHILARRAKDEHVKQRLYDIIYRYEDHIRSVGENLRDGNPTPGNKAGGLSTIEEKSLGCIHKGGHSTILEVLEYGEEPTQKGLVIMDTPGYDVVSLCGMAAGGAQLAVFTSGRGTPVGNPIMPVIKITGNKNTWRNMECNMDFNASLAITGEATLEELGKKLFTEVLEVANGKVTKAEVFKMNDVGMSRLCNNV